MQIERLDAHPGDLYGRKTSVEVASDLLLGQLLTEEVAPFFAAAPAAHWTCRSHLHGQWRDWAEVVTVGSPEQQGARLLVADEQLEVLHEKPSAVFRVACRPGRE